MGNIDKYSVLPQVSLYDFLDKNSVIADDMDYMLIRTQSMFEYDGLPDTIPKRNLELLLQGAGYAIFVQHNGELYALYGSLGGEPDPNYNPTLAVIANPALRLSKSYIIDKDCVVMRNDALCKGLLPISSRYATLLCENLITMRMAVINQRGQSLISATDDRTLKSANAYIEGLEAGKQKAVSSSEFFDSLKVSPYANTGSNNLLTSIIELQQYLRASWFNDLGLSSNYNMKREAINSNESQLNEEMLHPLVDNMLFSRQEALDKINTMFGTNIKVRLSSSWEENELEDSTEGRGGG